MSPTSTSATVRTTISLPTLPSTDGVLRPVVVMSALAAIGTEVDALNLGLSFYDVHAWHPVKTLAQVATLIRAWDEAELCISRAASILRRTA